VRLVYYGTPDIAVPPLARLLDDGRAPLLVVTRADRPRGRGLRVEPSPVRAFAESRGLPVAVPRRASDPGELERLRALEPDLLVLVAYGQILSGALLAIPRIGAINVHFSLLPRHRGASPVQAALLAGDAETGVCTMWMTEGLDEGPVFLVERTPVAPGENAGGLGARLSVLGADLLARTLARIEAGAIVRTPQDPAGATYAPRITADMSLLSLAGEPVAFARRVRALTPAPGAALDLESGRLQVLAAEPAEEDAGSAAGPAGARPGTADVPPQAADAPPGTVLQVDRARGLCVRLGRGSVWIARVRPAGRREMSGADYANGARLRPGARLAVRDAAP
jgi:methionyl-tRNA formyltransferase